MQTPWTNSQTKEQSEVNNRAFDRQCAEDAALGAKVLQARGIEAPWTAIEKKVAAYDLEAAQAGFGEAVADWREEAAQRIAAVEIVEPVSPEAWLKAARARSAAVEVELRASDAPYRH